MHVYYALCIINYALDHLCPRTTIQYQVESTISISWRFVSFYPRVSLKYSRFLYYFCLCKSFKELFFSSPRSESGCKGTNFFRTAKTFKRKFSSFMQNLSHSWQISRHKKAYTLLIYIKEEKFRMIRAARVIRENKGIICLEIWRIKKKAVPLRPI